MALIHEQLYQVDDLANVHFAGFVQELTTNLMRSYSISDSRIELELDVQDVEMVIDTAIPCGLIINELFANSLQYAFPDGREGRIRMEFSEPEEGQYKLSFSDDGVGLPEGFDFESTKTMGLQLVRILSEQLNSETVVQSDPGTSFTFNFREYLEAGSVLY
jgi:two-component sensor histidine kinase